MWRSLDFCLEEDTEDTGKKKKVSFAYEIFFFEIFFKTHLNPIKLNKFSFHLCL